MLHACHCVHKCASVCATAHMLMNVYRGAKSKEREKAQKKSKNKWWDAMTERADTITTRKQGVGRGGWGGSKKHKVKYVSIPNGHSSSVFENTETPLDLAYKNTTAVKRQKKEPYYNLLGFLFCRLPETREDAST